MLGPSERRPGTTCGTCATGGRARDVTSQVPDRIPMFEGKGRLEWRIDVARGTCGKLVLFWTGEGDVYEKSSGYFLEETDVVDIHTASRSTPAQSKRKTDTHTHRHRHPSMHTDIHTYMGKVCH